MTIRVVHICTIPMSIKLLLGDQIEYLESRGYEVHSMSAPGTFQDELVERGFRWHPIRITRAANPLDDPPAIFDIVRHCRREQFTIVHTHTPKGILLGQIGGHIARVPIVGQTLHGFYFGGMQPSPQRTFVRSLEALSCKMSDFVLSQSAEDAELIQRERFCDPSKVSTLGNGVDVDRFVPPTLSNEELSQRRRAVGLHGEGPVVGIVGRYVVEKGYRELCEAVEKLVHEFPMLQVLCIGTNPGEERSDEIIRPEEHPTVGDRFVCLYDRNDMADLYALMDIFVLPSYREGFPRSCMEASATARPVITTQVRGCREAVHHEDNGILIPPKDADALAEALKRLLTRPDLCAQYGERGRTHALERFDQRIVFERVVQCYETQLRARNLPVPS